MEVKTDFKDKAKPKVGSKDNMTYTPGQIANCEIVLTLHVNDATFDF